MINAGIRVFVHGQDTEIVEYEPGDQIGSVDAVVDVLRTRGSSLASDGFYPFDV